MMHDILKYTTISVRIFAYTRLFYLFIFQTKCTNNQTDLSKNMQQLRNSIALKIQVDNIHYIRNRTHDIPHYENCEFIK